MQSIARQEIGDYIEKLWGSNFRHHYIKCMQQGPSHYIKQLSANYFCNAFGEGAVFQKFRKGIRKMQSSSLFVGLIF